MSGLSARHLGDRRPRVGRMHRAVGLTLVALLISAAIGQERHDLVQFGPGEEATLRERLGQGGVVELDAGRYALEEPLVLTEPVVVQGAGTEDTIIESPAAPAIVGWQGSGALRFSDLTLVSTHVHEPEPDGTAERAAILRAERGEVFLERVVLEYASGHGLELSGTAHATLIDVESGRHSGNGLSILDDAHAQVEGGVLIGNGLLGVAMWGNATASFTATALRRNERHGLGVADEASATLMDADVRHNGEAGAVLRGDARVQIRASDLRENLAFGVAADGTSHVDVSGSTLVSNRIAGMTLAGSAQAVITGSRLEANGGYGLYAEGDTTARVDDTTFAHNGVNGVACEGHATVRITHSRIADHGHGPMSVGDEADCTQVEAEATPADVSGDEAENVDDGMKVDEADTSPECPAVDAPGAELLFEHAGNHVHGWRLSERRTDLWSTLRVDLAGGETRCFQPVGGFVTFAKLDAPDPSGEGPLVHVLIQEHGVRRCEQDIRVLELSGEPRWVFALSSDRAAEGEDGWYPVCPAEVEDLDEDGYHELIIADDYWSRPGLRISTCTHAAAAYVPTVFAFDGTTYQVVDPADSEPRIPLWALRAVYDAYLGGYLRRYAALRAEPSDSSNARRLRCVATAIVLPWFYLRETNVARSLFDDLYDGSDAEAVWTKVVESVSTSRYVGEWYR